MSVQSVSRTGTDKLPSISRTTEGTAALSRKEKGHGNAAVSATRPPGIQFAPFPKAGYVMSGNYNYQGQEDNPGYVDPGVMHGRNNEWTMRSLKPEMGKHAVAGPVDMEPAAKEETGPNWKDRVSGAVSGLMGRMTAPKGPRTMRQELEVRPPTPREQMAILAGTDEPTIGHMAHSLKQKLHKHLAAHPDAPKLMAAYTAGLATMPLLRKVTAPRRAQYEDYDWKGAEWSGEPTKFRPAMMPSLPGNGFFTGAATAHNRLAEKYPHLTGLAQMAAFAPAAYAASKHVLYPAASKALGAIGRGVKRTTDFITSDPLEERRNAMKEQQIPIYSERG